MQEIPKWDSLWEELIKNEQIKAKIQTLNLLDSKFGFENDHTYKICKDIYYDYLNLIKDEDNQLEKIKQTLFQKFHNFSYVYSVTTRVKKLPSLIQKIVLRRFKYYGDRKIGDKYRNITKETYRNVITDLIGARVTVRNTEEFRKFDNDLKLSFVLRPRNYEHGAIFSHEDIPIIAEYPVFKHPKYETKKLECFTDIFYLEPQESGYRSIHYTLSKDCFYIELQLRTIFDDGWSECNHEFVYKKENHPYYRALFQLSDILRFISSSSNDICSLMSNIYNNHLNDKANPNKKSYSINHNENESLIEIEQNIEKISKMLDGFNKLIQ